MRFKCKNHGPFEAKLSYVIRCPQCEVRYVFDMALRRFAWEGLELEYDVMEFNERAQFMTLFDFLGLVSLKRKGE